MERREHWLEVVSAIVLALATIGTAWCAYQSSRWSGVQTIDFNEASAARTQSVQKSNLAAQLTAIDVGVWIQYVTAISQGNQRLADFLSERFRPPLKSANQTWLATKPLQNPDAPSSPFAMKEYSVPEATEAAQLENHAEQKTAEAKLANQHSDNYILLTVIFASVLFFVGVGSKFETYRLRFAAITFGALVLIVVAAVLSTYPVY